LAGALALVALALIEIVLAVVPVRRCERWAMVAAALPFAIIGIPVLAIDAANVASEHL
jgi:hypothetical protein